MRSRAFSPAFVASEKISVQGLSSKSSASSCAAAYQSSCEGTRVSQAVALRAGAGWHSLSASSQIAPAPELCRAAHELRHYVDTQCGTSSIRRSARTSWAHFRYGPFGGVEQRLMAAFRYQAARSSARVSNRSAPRKHRHSSSAHGCAGGNVPFEDRNAGSSTCARSATLWPGRTGCQVCRPGPAQEYSQRFSLNPASGSANSIKRHVFANLGSMVPPPSPLQ